MSAVIVQTGKKETQKLLGVFLRASLHVIETRQTPDGVVDVLWGQRVAVLLQFIRLQSQAELLNRAGRIDNLEISQKHNHGINKRGLRLEAMHSALRRLVQEVVKGCAEKKHLKNLSGC